MKRATDAAKPQPDCPRPIINDEGVPFFEGSSITFHDFMVYISGACLAVTFLCSIWLNYSHLHRYTNAQEQRQILRIINLPIAYSIFNLLALVFTMDYQFIEPIAAIYEALTVAALFFLVLEWVCPDGTDREQYFDRLELRSRRGRPLPGGSLQWFQRTWSTVLQYPLSKTLFVIVQIVTQYFQDYCEGSWSPKHAHLYLFIVDILLIGGALGATIRFFRRLVNECGSHHKPRAKVISFIGIVAFQFIQNVSQWRTTQTLYPSFLTDLQIIFHLLNSKVFNPSPKTTYNDINFGIASFMTCMEAVLFALIFTWSFSSSEYKDGRQFDRTGGLAQRTSTLKAILSALNMSDIVAGSVLAFQLIFMRVRSRYGGRPRGPTRQKTLRAEDQLHLEPLSGRMQQTAYGYGGGPPNPPNEPPR